MIRAAFAELLRALARRVEHGPAVEVRVVQVPVAPALTTTTWQMPPPPPPWQGPFVSMPSPNRCGPGGFRIDNRASSLGL